MARIPWRQLRADAAEKPLDWTDVGFDEAIQFLLDKGAISDDEYRQIEAWAKTRAFTVAGVTSLDLIQATLDNLTETLQDGGTLADFAAGVNVLFAAQGLDPLDPWRLETIFRTNVMSAYGAGRWDQITDPDIADEIFGWEFDGVGDDREDEECDAVDGHVFEGSDGAEYFPPIHVNCRCTSKIITQAEAEAEGIMSSGDVPQVTKDYVASSNFDSPAVSADLSPNLSKYAPSLLSDYYNDRAANG